MRKAHLALIYCSLSALFFFSSSPCAAAVRVEKKIVDGNVQLLTATRIDKSIAEAKVLRKLPYYFDLDQAVYAGVYYEQIEVPDRDITPEIQQLLERPVLMSFDDTEVRNLVVQGDARNRINLTILGDGYLVSQKEKFFLDAQNIVRGLFGARAFSSYKSLFNVYAVFVPSNEEGVGDGGPKNTAFKLYRIPKGSKRGIIAPEEGERALEDAIRLSPATDYPIVIANDEFYGGLGGRFAITTSSQLSGLVVLRHELGHNFGEVGEEYDNGQVYYGANSSDSPSLTELPWRHWIDQKLEVYEAELLTKGQDAFLWKNLKDGGYEANLDMPQALNRLYLILSSVGWETKDDVNINLDGKALKYTGKFHADRSFYFIPPMAVASGQMHKLSITENIKDDDNVLGFAFAYAVPENYDFSPNKLGAFATYNINGKKSYRPTHQSCAMRDMELDVFCPIDKENMWIKFLNRTSLIDNLRIKSENGKNVLMLRTQSLPGFMSINWYLVSNGNTASLPEFDDKLAIPIDGLKGSVRVKVKFSTPEVKINSKLLEQSKDIQLPE